MEETIARKDFLIFILLHTHWYASCSRVFIPDHLWAARSALENSFNKKGNNTMKKFATLVTLLAAFSAPLALAQTDAKAPAAEVKYNTQELTPAQTDVWLAKPDKVLFIDIRRPDELITYGSFPVFLNIQLADLEKNLAFIPKDRTIITVSNHAKRAFKAGDWLTSKGFKVAGAVGSESYEQAGGKFVTKIVKPAPKPTASN